MNIYKITNLVNGKCYIGRTKQKVEFRFYQHCFEAKKQQTGYPIHLAILEFGEENFKIELLFSNLSKEEAVIKERELILENNSLCTQNGYNIRTGAKFSVEEREKPGSFTGKTHTEETRKKISAILKGSHHKNPRTPGYHIKPRSEERQKQVSDSHKATSNFCAPDAVRSVTGMVYKSEADKTPEEEARRKEVRKAVVANMRAKWKIWFDSLTPEQKAERAAKQRAQLDKAREKMVKQLRAGEITIGPKPKVKTVSEILQQTTTPCDTISV